MAFIAVDLTPIQSGGANGGAKVFVLELLKRLSYLMPEDHFLLLTASWNNDELSLLDSHNMRRLCVTGGSAVHFPKLPGGRFSQIVVRRMKKLWRRIKRKSPSFKGILSEHGVDILFCPFTAPTYAEPGIKLVSIVYDFQHRDYPQFFSREEIDGRDSFLEDVRARADRIVCISETVRQSAIKHLNIDSDKSQAIHISIQSRLDTQLDKTEVSSALNSIGINQRPYMFYPANFWPHKNHKMLIVAYSMFLARHPECNLDLVLTGALEMQQALMKDASRIGLSGRIHFLGFVPSDKLQAIWQGCDFLVYPSLYEGFGIPVLEAMTFGKPVICSNVTSLPEVAGDAAIYFDPRIPESIAECMEKIAFDKGLQQKMVARGNKRVSEFSLDDMANEYMNTFHAVLNE